MRRVFADTAYWVGLRDPDDQWHAAAAAASKKLGSVELVTTEPVLTELLNYFTNFRTRYWRLQALQMVDDIRNNPNVRVIPQTHDLFESGLERFRRRLDQSYGHTDCMSMDVMDAYGIKEILTVDGGFTAAGYTRIM